MNRQQRRAFGRLFKGRPAAQPDPEVAVLKARIEALEAKQDALPGLVEGRKDWFVLVDGQQVPVKALPPIEWVRSHEELPAFLFTFASNRLSGGGLDEEALTKVNELARRWITACAVSMDGVDLDRLTFVEAQHAVAQIANLNGVTDSLRAWFRERLAGVADAAPSRKGVRAAAIEPAGDLPN